MRFDSPEILWLLLLPLALILSTLTGKMAHYTSKVLRLQSLVAIVLLVSLANPIRDNFGKTGNAAIVVDLSASVDPSEMNTLYQKARELAEELPNVVIIPFAEKSPVFMRFRSSLPVIIKLNLPLLKSHPSVAI